jgi:hypothetical protein
MRPSDRWSLLFLSVSLLSVSSGVAAQSWVVLPDSGNHVRVQTSDGSLHEGRLVAANPDAVTFLPRGTRGATSTPSSVPMSEIEQVWVRRGSVGRGFAIGAIAGGVVGAVGVGQSCSGSMDCDVFYLIGALGGALGGGLLGALVGAAARSWELTYSASPGPSGPLGGLVVRIPY